MITITERVSALAPNTPTTATMIQPSGYNTLAGFYINPAIEYEITVRSQKTNEIILDSFVSLIGLSGFIPLARPNIDEDRFVITFVNRDAAVQNVFLTALFSQINE